MWAASSTSSLYRNTGVCTPPRTKGCAEVVVAPCTRLRPISGDDREILSGCRYAVGDNACTRTWAKWRPRMCARCRTGGGQMIAQPPYTLGSARFTRG